MFRFLENAKVISVIIITSKKKNPQNTPTLKVSLGAIWTQNIQQDWE